jgi:hypothetical protein
VVFVSKIAFRAHSFFRTDLPLYIHVPQDQSQIIQESVDHAIVEVVTTLNHAKELVYDAVRCGVELFMDEKYPKKDPRRPAALAYYLLLDEKRKKEKRKIRIQA